MSLFTARGFGVNWLADLPLAQFDPLPPGSTCDIELVQIDALKARPNPQAFHRGAVFADGFRFRWEDEAEFDFHAPGRIEFAAGAGWTGTLPAAFYSTVVSLALAWRGCLALHASAVDIGGKAVLLSGKAGAGKSTLLAELLGNGGRLISDDLTVLTIAPDGQPLVWRGRRSIRLHPATAASLACERIDDVPEDPRGKQLAWPKARSATDCLPVCGLLILGDHDGPIAPLALAPILPELLFRPAWTAQIPGKAARSAALLALAKAVPTRHFPAVTGFSAQDRAARLARLSAALATFG